MQKLRNFFYLDNYLVKENDGLVSTTFSLEQKSGFKLEINKDLTFILIIIDIDCYEKNHRDNFFGPYRPALLVTIYICFMYDNRKYVNENNLFGHSIIIKYVTV